MSKAADLKDLNNEAYADQVRQLREALGEWLERADNADNYLVAMPSYIHALSDEIYLIMEDKDISQVYDKEEVRADYEKLINLCDLLKAQYSGSLRCENFVALVEHTVTMIVKFNGLADLLGYTGEGFEYARFGSEDPRRLADADIAFKALCELTPGILGAAVDIDAEILSYNY